MTTNIVAHYLPPRTKPVPPFTKFALIGRPSLVFKVTKRGIENGIDVVRGLATQKGRTWSTVARVVDVIPIRDASRQQ